MKYALGTTFVDPIYKDVATIMERTEYLHVSPSYVVIWDRIDGWSSREEYDEETVDQLIAQSTK